MAPLASAAEKVQNGLLTGPTGVCSQYDPFGAAIGRAAVFSDEKKSDEKKPSDGNVWVVLVAEELMARQAYEVWVAESIGGSTPGCGAELLGTTVTSGGGKLRFDGQIKREPGTHSLQVFVKGAGQEHWVGYATEPLAYVVP